MSLYNIGRICMKIAGRDAGKTCVVVEALDKNFVMIDGQTRRRKVNIKHLEPINKIIKIKEKASHAEVKTAFSKLKLKVLETKTKKTTEKPIKIRKAKVKVEKKPTVKKIKDKKKEAEPKKEKVKKIVTKTKIESKGKNSLH